MSCKSLSSASYVIISHGKVSISLRFMKTGRMHLHFMHFMKHLRKFISRFPKLLYLVMFKEAFCVTQKLEYTPYQNISQQNVSLLQIKKMQLNKTSYPFRKVVFLPYSDTYFLTIFLFRFRRSHGCIHFTSKNRFL